GAAHHDAGSAGTGASDAGVGGGGGGASLCPWPAMPMTGVTSTGAPSGMFLGKSSLFSWWLEGGANATGAHLIRSDLPNLTSTTIWQGDPLHPLVGVSSEEVFVGHQDETPSWLDVTVLSHDGTKKRTVPLDTLPLSFGGAFRVGDHLYAI